MDTVLYSPDATCWNLRGPENPIDRHNMITKRVREYTYRGVLFTILACIDINVPHDIFYELEVKRPLDENVPTKPDADFRIVKRLLAYAPISDEQYRTAEQKVYTKLAKYQQVHFEKTKVNDEIEDELVGIGEATDDDGDDDCFGGIMGVFCGSSLHVNY